MTLFSGSRSCQGQDLALNGIMVTVRKVEADLQLLQTNFLFLTVFLVSIGDTGV